MLFSICLDLPPGNHPDGFAQLEKHIDALDAASADAVLLGREDRGSIYPGRLESLLTLPWLAGRLRNAALIAVVPAAATMPFHVARALSAIDFLSDGRAGWMPVFHKDASLAHYDDLIHATQALWDSWDDDALIIDKANGRYLDSGKVRRVHYQGPFFSTVGPLNAARPPQGYPLLGSEWGHQCAASISKPDFVVLSAPSVENASAQIAALRTQGSTPLIFLKAETDAQCGSLELTDALNLAEDGRVDGLHLTGAAALETLVFLRSRFTAGPFMAGQTARARLGLKRPANPFTQEARA